LHALAYRQIPQAELVGVYDVDRERCLAVAAECQTGAFDRLDPLLEAVEAITLAVPTADHWRMARRSINRGIHVLVEKPIAASLEEADAMITAATAAGVVLQVGHIERFNPAVRALEGILLDPMFIESHRLAPFEPRGTDVAVVLDLMIHDIDILLTLVKSPVARIDANGVAVVSDEEDIANARIQFQNGCVANVTASRISQRKMRKMRLFQRDAYISMDFLEGLTEMYRLVDSEENMPATIILGQIDKGKRQRRIIYERLPTPEKDALQSELEAFLDSIATGKPPVVSGEEGRKALEVAVTISTVIKQSVQFQAAG